MTAMITKRITNGMASHLSTLQHGGVPEKRQYRLDRDRGHDMKMTLAGAPTAKPARTVSAIAAKTMSAMPSISNPTCVTQLKNDGSRLPCGPNGARLIAKVVVPACGPCRLASPVST